MPSLGRNPKRGCGVRCGAAAKPPRSRRASQHHGRREGLRVGQDIHQRGKRRRFGRRFGEALGAFRKHGAERSLKTLPASMVVASHCSLASRFCGSARRPRGLTRQRRLRKTARGPGACLGADSPRRADLTCPLSGGRVVDGAPLFGEGLVSPASSEVPGTNDVPLVDRGLWPPVSGEVGPLASGLRPSSSRAAGFGDADGFRTRVIPSTLL
jgi:hypothetical protein